MDSEHALEGSRNLLLVYGAGAVIGPTTASLVMAQVGPGSLLLYIIATQLFLTLFTMHHMRVRKPIPTEDQVEFIAVVRTSPVALELDPRIDNVDDNGAQTAPRAANQ